MEMEDERERVGSQQEGKTISNLAPFRVPPFLACIFASHWFGKAPKELKDTNASGSSYSSLEWPREMTPKADIAVRQVRYDQFDFD